MPRPTIHDGHQSREMTADEYAQWQQDAADAAAQAAAADAKAAALASARNKLRDLLTDDEIAALLGE